MTYGARTYAIPPEVLERLKETSPARCFLAAALAWVAIYALVRGFLWLGNWWLYPVVIFLIAGRAGVFLQLTHEATHGLVGGKRLNAWFGNWIGAYPIGLNLKGYAEPHLRHHACANRSCDPIGDREKYRVCDPRDRRLWLLFLKDACGWTALRGQYLYANAAANQDPGGAQDFEEDGEIYRRVAARHASQQERLRNLLGIAAWQLAICASVFHANPAHYVLLWLIPLATAHMVLMRFRGIAEHGLPSQLGLTMEDFDAENENGTYFTRSFGCPTKRYWFRPLNWLETILIGSLNVNRHHEHHCWPKIPYYNLPAIHDLVARDVALVNPDVQIRGYFDAMLVPGRLRSRTR